MVGHGAKNLILLSRGASTKEGLISHIQKADCRVKAINCDISNATDLQQALDLCAKEQFPPIRGLVQAAMVMKVNTKLIRQVRICI